MPSLRHHRESLVVREQLFVTTLQRPQPFNVTAQRVSLNQSDYEVSHPNRPHSWHNVTRVILRQMMKIAPISNSYVDLNPSFRKARVPQQLDAPCNATQLVLIGYVKAPSKRKAQRSHTEYGTEDGT
jgi:hypothetical protein